jgi:hypothetical protein
MYVVQSKTFISQYEVKGIYIVYEEKQGFFGVSYKKYYKVLQRKLA